jgi:thiol-disulfide isomerase/thioredoxin
MFQKSLLATLISLSVLFQACSDSEDPNELLTTHQYTLSDLTSTQHTVTKGLEGFSLQGAEGKVILFDIFATWCPPCQDGATHLTSLQEKYKDQLVVVGVTIEDTVTNEKLLEFREKYNAHYTLTNSKENRRLVDAIASHLELGERFPIPVLAMYKDGALINYYIGAVQEEFIESDIKQALGK